MLSDSWKRWIAEHVLLKMPDQDIIDALTHSGIDEQLAREELALARENPYIQSANSYPRLLHKRWSVHLIQQELAHLDPKNKIIERRTGLSRQEFLDQYYSQNRPVILCDLMNNWKAPERWTSDYLKSVCGDEIVEIMGSREGANYEWDVGPHRRSIRFADYVDMVDNTQGTNDYYLVARNKFFRNVRARELLNDIEVFPEYLTGDLPDGAVNFWFGPAGTITPLHHDQMNILMAQVKGRKRVVLIPAYDTDLVYNYDVVYGHVDCEKPDYEKFPKFRDAIRIEFDLVPGEVLFLPVGWWHHVKALDTSITVTFTKFVFPNAYEWVHPKAA